MLDIILCNYCSPLFSSIMMVLNRVTLIPSWQTCVAIMDTVTVSLKQHLSYHSLLTSFFYSTVLLYGLKHGKEDDRWILVFANLLLTVGFMRQCAFLSCVFTFLVTLVQNLGKKKGICVSTVQL